MPAPGGGGRPGSSRVAGETEEWGLLGPTLGRGEGRFDAVADAKRRAGCLGVAQRADSVLHGVQPADAQAEVLANFYRLTEADGLVADHERQFRIGGYVKLDNRPDGPSNHVADGQVCLSDLDADQAS